MRDETGSNSTEYLLVLTLVAAVIVGAALVFGRLIDNAFVETCDEVGTAIASYNPALDCP